MNEIRKLASIWEEIPRASHSQIELSLKDVVRKYLNLFHVGEFFYLIFNTSTTEMEFVDEGIVPILGIQPKEFSITELLRLMHPEDLPYFAHYEKSAVRFFSSLSPDLFFKYKFSYDYRVQTQDGKYKRILQQVVPVYYFPEGGARTLAVMTDVTYLDISGIPKLSFIGMEGAPSYYNVHLTDEFKLSKQLFTSREKEILSLMTQGFTSEVIAEKLFRSVHTVRTHRKNILEKSGCTSLQELLVRSVREGWI